MQNLESNKLIQKRFDKFARLDLIESANLFAIHYRTNLVDVLELHRDNCFVQSFLLLKN